MDGWTDEWVDLNTKELKVVRVRQTVRSKHIVQSISYFAIVFVVSPEKALEGAIAIASSLTGQQKKS